MIANQMRIWGQIGIVFEMTVVAVLTGVAVCGVERLGSGQ